MGGRRQNGVVASLLISIFLFSLLSPLVGPVEESELNVEFTSPSIGQTSTVSIGSYPDGVNDATSISVPSGEAISGIELSLDESVLPVSAAKMFDSPAAYDRYNRRVFGKASRSLCSLGGRYRSSKNGTVSGLSGTFPSSSSGDHVERP